MSPGDRPGRRGVLHGAAASVTALPLLAACGSSPSGSDAPSPGTELGSTDQIPVGEGRIFPDAKVVVTQPTRGEFKGFSAVCTHQGCLVAQVVDGVIRCPCHGSQFSVKDGSVVHGPARDPLPPREIRVRDGSITTA